MKFFLVINSKNIKHALIVVVAALFTAGILYIENIQQSVFSTKEGPRAIYKGEAKGKVSLTFNIDWGDEMAEPIIDLLEKEKIKNATFFLSASWAERHPDLVDKIIKNGHEIGSLGYRYKSYTDLDVKKIKKDLSLAQTAFNDLGIKDIQLFRPPNGNINEEVIKTVESAGYSVVHWKIDSEDTNNISVKQIVNNVLTDIEEGDIILLHASDSATNTEKAIPLILKGLKNKGLENISVSELIANADAKSEETK